jgi:hypothetical protein
MPHIIAPVALPALQDLDMGRIAGISTALALNGAMWSALVRLAMRFFLHH